MLTIANKLKCLLLFLDSTCSTNRYAPFIPSMQPDPSKKAKSLVLQVLTGLEILDSIKNNYLIYIQKDAVSIATKSEQSKVCLDLICIQ